MEGAGTQRTRGAGNAIGVVLDLDDTRCTLGSGLDGLTALE